MMSALTILAVAAVLAGGLAWLESRFSRWLRRNELENDWTIFEDERAGR